MRPTCLAASSCLTASTTVATPSTPRCCRTVPAHTAPPVRDLHGIHRSCRLVACQRPGPVRDRPGQGLGVAPDQHRTHARQRAGRCQRFQGQRRKQVVHVRRQLWICRLRCPLRLQPTRSRQPRFRESVERPEGRRLLPHRQHQARWRGLAHQGPVRRDPRG